MRFSVRVELKRVLQDELSDNAKLKKGKKLLSSNMLSQGGSIIPDIPPCVKI